jgi:YD repeat-containing protein
VTDAIGRTTTYCYTVNHEVTEIIEADGSVTSAPVDAAGNPTASTDALGRSTQYQFDERGNLTGITDAAGASTKIVYSALGATPDTQGMQGALPPDLPIRHTDALGNEFTSEYDRWGNLIAMRAPLVERAQLQKLSTFVATSDAPTHAITRYTYDARGLPASVADANGGVKRLRWDDAGQLTEYTDCSDRTTRYEYDALGNLSTITDALGQRTHYVHDALGQLRMVTQPDGGSHHYHYDGAGNLSSYTDPLGASTSYRYNGIDLPVERIDATGAKLNYVYDDMGRLIVLQNENRAHYRFFYDIVDNLIEEIGFDGRVQRYGYNKAGELTHLIEAGGSEAGPGKLTWFERDALGRLTTKRHSSESHSAPTHGPVGASNDAAAYTTLATPTTFTYDPLGRMVACANAEATVGFAYNPLSWLTTETQTHVGSAPTSFTLRHGYDPLGNRTHTELPGPDGQVQKRLHFLYYGSGHLHQINVAERNSLAPEDSPQAWQHHTLVDMERDALHREIERSQGAVTSHYGIDPMGRLTAHKISRNATVAQSRARAQNNSADTLGRVSLPHLQGETTLPNAERIKRSYGYDDAGNLTTVADALRGKSTYQYDALSRIRAAERAGTNAASSPTNERFDFDPAGNLLNANAGAGTSQSSGGVSSSQIYNNRIAVFQDLRFAYDVHGNVIERLEGWHTQQHFSYSAEHQLTSATVTRFAEKPDKQSARRLVAIDEDADDAIKRAATTQTTHYRYDPLGRRIDKTDTFGSTIFIYDGDLLIGELRGSKLSEYVYEPVPYTPDYVANGVHEITTTSTAGLITH